MSGGRDRFAYQVVTTNGHGVFGLAHKSFGAARESAERVAADWSLPDTLFEVLRTETVDRNRYWLRQRKRWVLWPCPDASVRKPDFFVMSKGSGA